jgi:peptidoglycan/LPS O-acetylase OafA/YrhL
MINQKRLLEIDGLRAVAISLVVLFHYTKEFFPQHRFFSFGWSGVDLFFVISGFVLYYQVKKRYYKDGKTQYISYLRNRAIRIIPAYYVSVIATILFFGKDKFFTSIFPLHLSFLYIFDYDVAISVQPLYWTLAVEVQFYIFLILIAPLFTGKNGMKWFLSLIGFNVVYRLIFPLFYSASSNTGLVLGNILPGRISEFCYGMIIAKIFIERVELMDKMRRPLIAVSIVFLAVAIISVCWAVWLRIGDSVLDHQIVNTLYYPFLGMGYGLLFFLVVLIPILKRIASLKPVVFIGTISYSIYLWHVFALRLVGNLLTGAAGFLFTLIATIVISTVSYYFIERTFLKLKA